MLTETVVIEPPVPLEWIRGLRIFLFHILRFRIYRMPSAEQGYIEGKRAAIASTGGTRRAVLQVGRFRQIAWRRW